MQKAGVQIAVSPWSRIAVFPMHHGHHAIWLSNAHQADVCNMTDDLLVRELVLGHLYRFPLTSEIYPWVNTLVNAMNEADKVSCSPWCSFNSQVRTNVMDAVLRRLVMQQKTPTEAAGGNVAVPIDPLHRNTFEPGVISPALRHPAITAVTDLLRQKITADGRSSIVE